MAGPINPISQNTRINKARLVDTLNGAISEINQIHDLYNKFFASPEGKLAQLQEIESKLDKIGTAYKDLFGSVPSKVDTADAALDKIKAYHAELLEGDESIEADIKDSQAKITEFYNKLFNSSDGTAEDDGQQALVEAAIKSITDFDALLNKDVTGYKQTIEAAKEDILAAHSNLFGKDKKSNKSKVELLDEQIAKTHEYHTQVKDDILPYINDRRTEIDQVSADIKTKEAEVDSLLSKATIRTLAQGYSEAMQIYGSPVLGEYPRKKKGEWRRSRYNIRAIGLFVKHFIKFVGSYALFIGPLVLIGMLFIGNSKEILGIENIEANTNIKFSGTEYIFYKLTIALPLLWVSWFGQRSIAHRKRLFEEYNHKLRVVQMYMLFTSRKQSFPLADDKQIKLEETLLETIERNPSEVYGRDETMLDRLIDVFSGKKKGEADDPPKSSSK